LQADHFRPRRMRVVANLEFAADTAASSAALLRQNGRFDCAGPVYFDLETICSTIFDSSLKNWEWHKEKKHRHPHLHLILLLAKPVDA